MNKKADEIAATIVGIREALMEKCPSDSDMYDSLLAGAVAVLMLNKLHPHSFPDILEQGIESLKNHKWGKKTK